MRETISLSNILVFFKPGSHGPEWTWLDEYADLIYKPETDAIRKLVLEQGIGFNDDQAPIMLGNDTRVWDGHHRIVIAIEQEIHKLNVEMV